MALEEDKEAGSWKEKNVCMGDTKTCSFPGLINQHHKFIISFAEDEAGRFAAQFYKTPKYCKYYSNNKASSIHTMLFFLITIHL